MRKSEKNLMYNIIMVFLAEIVPTVTGFILLPIFTNTVYVSENSYGTYDMLSSIISILLPIFSLQISTAVFRQIIGVNDEQIIGIISSGTSFLIGICTLVALLIIFLPIYNLEIRVLFSIWYFSKQMITFFRYISKGFGKFNIYAKSIAIEAIFNLVISYICILKLHMEFAGIILGIIISEILTILYLWFKLHLKKYYKFHHFDKNIIKKLLLFSVPLVPNAISLWIIKVSDRLIVSAYIGVAANALYAVANKVPSIYAGINSVFNTAWMESISKNSTSVYWEKIFYHYWNILTSITLLTIAGTPTFFMFCINPTYYNALTYVPPLVIAFFVAALGSFQTSIFFALNESKIIGISTLLSAVVNVIVNILAIGRLGLYAAVFSTLIAYIIAYIVKAVFLKRHNNSLHMDMRKDICFILALCLICYFYYNEKVIINIFLAIIYTVFACRKYIFALKNKLKSR